MFGATGPLRSSVKRRLPKHLIGLSRWLAHLGLQSGCVLSPETQRTSADYSTTSIADWATIKDRQLCLCPLEIRISIYLASVLGRQESLPAAAWLQAGADMGAGEKVRFSNQPNRHLLVCGCRPLEETHTEN